MSRRVLSRDSGALLLPLTDGEISVVGGTGNFPNAAWVEVVGYATDARLIARRARTPVVARRRHIERPALDVGREQTENERRFGLRRKLQRLGDGWALPLSAEQLKAIGVDESDPAVLVLLEEGNPPRLVIRRAPTFEAAMEASLEQHGEALRRLATVPDMPFAS